MLNISVNLSLAPKPPHPTPTLRKFTKKDAERVLKTSFYINSVAQSKTQSQIFFSLPLVLNFGFLPQLSRVTNKAECGGTGLCRSGLEARGQIERVGKWRQTLSLA